MKRPSIPQPPQGDEGSSNLTKAAPLGENGAVPGQPKGFDLSGDEFQVQDE